MHLGRSIHRGDYGCWWGGGHSEGLFFPEFCASITSSDIRYGAHISGSHRHSIWTGPFYWSLENSIGDNAYWEIGANIGYKYEGGMNGIWYTDLHAALHWGAISIHGALVELITMDIQILEVDYFR